MRDNIASSFYLSGDTAMWFFTPKKKSLDDAAIKSLMSVSSQRNLKNFLEAEKNMFDHLKAFITLSFLLNTGCLGILFKFRPDLEAIIYILSIGTLLSMISYVYAFKFLNASMNLFFNYDYIDFMKMRRKAYVSSYVGVFFSVLSFELSLFYYIYKNMLITIQ